MVDVSGKAEVFREATATGKIHLKAETVSLISKAIIAKGNPLLAAKIAGVLAAKKTSELVPLCHPLPLQSVKIEAKIMEKTSIQVTATVKTKAQTGVEMEALCAVSVGLLTIWDMVKQYEKNKFGQYPNTAIKNIHVLKKFKRE